MSETDQKTIKASESPAICSPADVIAADEQCHTRTESDRRLPAETESTAMPKIRKVSVASLEKQISEIASALQNQNRAIGSLAAGLSELQVSVAQSVAETVAQHLPVAVHSEVSIESDDSPMQPDADAWSDIKNAMLDTYVEAENPDRTPGRLPDTEESVDSVKEATADTSDAEREAAEAADEELDTLLARIPALGIGEEIADDKLREAIADRDQFIRLLTAQLQRNATRPMSADQLRQLKDQIPEDLRERVEESLNTLDRQVRLGELELSLERARISRQITTLEQTRERLESAARLFGTTLNDDGTLAGEAQIPQKGTRGRRWLGAMGFGN